MMMEKWLAFMFHDYLIVYLFLFLEIVHGYIFDNWEL